MIFAPLRTIRVSFSKRIELFIAVSGNLLRLELIERHLETRPLLLDHFPGKARRKHRLGHACEKLRILLAPDIGIDLPLPQRSRNPLGSAMMLPRERLDLAETLS
jgi:hypothetical protein